ncbi:DUF3081 family protein [Rheinheimera salexigens]|uniref:DUF3081 domain-containing protein n=1 Tax=Rheinheimera salexigens TaxID=1628148 RepID=A0A1E7Q5M2_9GAMM|nr:DUF3081 family protein [Rheinheimera salexigens]OEY69465.1 hypothetical protein BI198_07710 [Rheinheimera salexigens]
MKNEIDGKFLLTVFAKVEKHGSAITNDLGAGFTLDGVTVNSGFDGYEAYFDNGKVQLTLGFHNQWNTNAENEIAFDEFMNMLNKINNNY